MPPKTLSSSAELSLWLSRRAAPVRAAAQSRAAAIDSVVNAAGRRVRRRVMKNRTKTLGSFGDLCELSEGRAVRWRSLGCTEREMWTFVEDAPFVLDTVVPVLHSLGFSENDVLELVPNVGPVCTLLMPFIGVLANPRRRPAEKIVYPCAAMIWTILSWIRRRATRQVARLEGRLMRPAYYEKERERRRVLEAERRKVRRRTTTNDCPTPEALIEAWGHVRESKEALIRFGSMVNDLECYVDNTLRRDGDGRIVGRNGGIKFWLETHAPELAKHYTSVIRYKSAAKKLRQIVGLSDPTPVAEVLEEGDAGNGRIAAARAAWREAMAGVPDVAAQVIDRIDELLDPEAVEEGTMLKAWKEKYAITERRKCSGRARCRKPREGSADLV
jgi:hypothetical protein